MGSLVPQGRESLTVLWRVVAQQSRLSLALVRVGIHIVYKNRKTKGKKKRIEKEKKKKVINITRKVWKQNCNLYMTMGCLSTKYVLW